MPDPELEPTGFPVMVGLVPLFCVTSFSLQEGYGSVKVGGTSSSLVQFVRPTTKKIVIKALLPGKWRLLRPALELMGMTSRAFAAAVAPLVKFTGIPVVAKTVVSLDMQVTVLNFTQDTEKRDTLVVDITLEHAPRSRVTELIGSGLDLGMAIGGPFIP
jgi:hypothetical protein